eukprot:jgi/Chlat1/2523/Chrsp175S02431
MQIGGGAAASASNAAATARRGKEKRVSYVLGDARGQGGHRAGVNAVVVADGGASLLSASRDATIKRWDLAGPSPSCTSTLQSHTDWVNDVALLGDDGSALVWRLEDGECVRTLRAHSDYVLALASAPQSNLVASGGLGSEVFLWDMEAAMRPLMRADDGEGPASTSPSGSSYAPLPARGHKDSVYALAMSANGSVVVSGSTEKAIRVWDPRTGQKQMKLKGHSDNVRALILDATGRLCLSGSSDATIRLWDLGQQRCIQVLAVHTESVWALAADSSFSNVYSGGRDRNVYCTNLATRESMLLFAESAPVLRVAPDTHNGLWVSSTDSSLRKWFAVPKTDEGDHPRMRLPSRTAATAFVAGSSPFARVRASKEEPTPMVPLQQAPAVTIKGSPGIVQHAVLNDRCRILSKDAAGDVALWSVTTGQVLAKYGQVTFEDKLKELFEQMSVPSWFQSDTKLGSIAVHLEPPQCFTAEMYATDLGIENATDDLKVNLGEQTLRGLFKVYLDRRKERYGPAASEQDDEGGDNNAAIVPPFKFVVWPSVITEGSANQPWRRPADELTGAEDERELPAWLLDCLLHRRLPHREPSKYGFYLAPYEGSELEPLTQGKLSAPRILRIQKVINYVMQRLQLGPPTSTGRPNRRQETLSQQSFDSNDGTANGASTAEGEEEEAEELPIEVVCNEQVLPPDMSLATVRTYVWKRPDDLVLYYRTRRRA